MENGLLTAAAMTRRQAERTLENMVDVGVLDVDSKMGNKGFRYLASPTTRKLSKVFGGG